MLHVTTGCMYSGKTTHLMKMAVSGGLIIDYDTHTDHGFITNHDNKCMPCYTIATLSSIYPTEVGTLFINEAQFFDDLVPFVKKMLSMGKTIHVYGLDGDFKQEPFGHILELIPFADTYTKLYAICHTCKGKASFSKRMSPNTTQYCPHDVYIPVCRACL